MHKISILNGEFIDGNNVKAHQHSTSSASKEQSITLSRGGNTGKIHLAVDSYGLPIEFIIKGGDIHDGTAANDLIELLPYADYLVADKGYDSEKLRDKGREQGKRVQSKG